MTTPETLPAPTAITVSSTRSAGAPTDSRPPGRPSRSAGFRLSARHSCGRVTPP